MRHKADQIGKVHPGQGFVQIANVPLGDGL